MAVVLEHIDLTIVASGFEYGAARRFVVQDLEHNNLIDLSGAQLPNTVFVCDISELEPGSYTAWMAYRFFDGPDTSAQTVSLSFTVSGSEPVPDPVASSQFTLLNDYVIFDGLENVWYFPPKTPEFSAATWTKDEGVLVRDARVEKIVTVEMEPSAGVYGKSDMRVRLPVKTCVPIPQMGGMIQCADESIVTILAVGMPRFQNSYSCECRTLIMSGGLKDTFELLSESHTNVKGSKVSTHTSIQSGISGRVQPLGEAEILFQNRLGFDVSSVIYLTVDLPWKFNDLLRDQNGVVYEIKSSSQHRRIDAFPKYHVKVRP